jgi:predicted ATPase
VRDPHAVLDAVMRALQLRDLHGDLFARIAASVQGRPTLVVLDNFEQLLAAAPVVSRLVTETRELRVLVTSQAPLRVAGEAEMGLGGLDAGGSVELFLERAQAAAPGWSPCVDDHETILEICRRVDCLPLGVELAAARVSILPPAELLDRLQRSSDILRGVVRDAPARHRSLRATFEWTYGLLSAAQRTLFYRLGTFAGPVPLGTIEAVCDNPAGDPPILALDLLDGLLEFSLVTREENTAGGRRFTMPQALRDFARAELLASGESEALRRRHAEHVAAAGDETRVWFAADSTAHARVFALDAEIRPALAWAAGNDSDLYRALVSALAFGLIRRGQVREALDHTTRAWSGDLPPRHKLDAWLGTCRAYALLMSGRADEAESLSDGCIAFYREHGDVRGLGLALHLAGWIADDGDRDRARALQLARESLKLLQSSGDRALADRGTGLLIQVLIHMNALDEAEPLLIQAQESITDPESDLANAVATMRGDTALARGNAPEAVGLFAESLQLAARRGDGIQVINDAHCVAHALALAGRPQAALEAAGTADAMAADSGYVNPWPEVQAAIDLARDKVGHVAGQLTARGRNLPVGERVSRILTLAQAASGDSQP